MKIKISTKAVSLTILLSITIPYMMANAEYTDLAVISTKCNDSQPNLQAALPIGFPQRFSTYYEGEAVLLPGICNGTTKTGYLLINYGIKNPSDKSKNGLRYPLIQMPAINPSLSLYKQPACKTQNNQLYINPIIELFVNVYQCSSP